MTLIATTPEQRIFLPRQEDHINLILADPELLEAIFQSILSGEIDSDAFGLTEPTSGTFNLLTQERVESWGPGVVVEKEFYKFQTMKPLTEHGLKLQSAVIALGLYTEKEANKYRITSNFLRKSSIDEVPQLLINVAGWKAKRYPDRLLMNVAGPVRPMFKQEIARGDDNSNDHYGRALELFEIPEYNDITPDDLHAYLGHISTLYRPGIITPTTAEGIRQRNNPNDYAAMIKGMLEYHRIQQLSPIKRSIAMARLYRRTTMHVLKATDAI